METLRRLRVVWTVLWLLPAGLGMILTVVGGQSGDVKNTLTAFFWATAAVSFAFGFHPTTWIGKLNTLWFGGVGMIAAGVAVHAPATALQSFAVIVGGYITDCP